MKRINNKLHKESFIVLQSFVDYFHNQKEIKKLFNLAFDEAKKNHTKH